MAGAAARRRSAVAVLWRVVAEEDGEVGTVARGWGSVREAMGGWEEEVE
jgi:hypothetical protein